MIIGADECKLQGTRIAWVGDLLSCHHCSSVWISAGLVILTQMVTHDVPYPPLAWPTVAAVGALIAHREDGPVYTPLEALLESKDG